MNGYDLSRKIFNYSFENPDKIKPNHIALFLYSVDLCNRLGWKNKFGMPTTIAMEAIGIKSYNTYIKTLNELVEFGFVIMIERSKNQHTANIIELSKNDKALDKALDKAQVKATSKQRESNSSIDKQRNKETKNKDNKGKEFIPPTIKQIEDYVKERGHNVNAETIYFYYAENNWKDKNDNPVKNWKRKISSVWFKDENKIDKTTTTTYKNVPPIVQKLKAKYQDVNNYIRNPKCTVQDKKDIFDFWKNKHAIYRIAEDGIEVFSSLWNHNKCTPEQMEVINLLRD